MNPTLLITLCTLFFFQHSIAQGQSTPITKPYVQKRELISHLPNSSPPLGGWGAERSSFANPDDLFTCGTDDRHEHLMATDATYRKNFLFHTHQLDSVLNTQSKDRGALPPQYTIPVVVHVIHLGEPVGTGSNISDAQILDAIDGLNERFANNNGQGADCEIEFCLATQAPDGCPTTGINRVNGSGVPAYAIEGIEYNSPCGASEADIKALSRWSPLQYYNIWVVHDICGDWAGYASFPNGGELDGTVIGKEFMHGDSKTLAHELGHGLNIRHTFNGDGGGNNCPSNTNCSSNGDAICDTPPHRRGDCDVTNPCSNEGVWDNSRYNWMSYCDTPVDIGRFTPGQRARMHAALLVFPRNALLNSAACTPMEQPAITSDDHPMCSGESRLLSATPPGGVFAVSGGPGSLQGNELIATGEGTIMIQYNACSFSLNQSIESYLTPEPTLTISNDTMCSSTAQFIFSNPPGGNLFIMSGPGSLLGNELRAEASGIIALAYTIDVNGCSGNTSQEIVVDPTPEPAFTSSDEAMCDGEFRVLSGLPAGGDFHVVSGPASLHGDTMITEGIGTVVLEYNVVLDECSGSTTQSIMVNELPAPEMTSNTELLCSGDERILSAIPPGGSFSVLSGPGEIIGDTLQANGTGDIEIQYTWNQNGCSAIATQIIQAQQSPGVNFNNSQYHFCMQDSIALIASPQGGIFELMSGPGELDSNILAATSGGEILISYAITQNGCTGSVEKLFSSIDASQLAFTMDTSVMCSGTTRPLTATPGGGIFWMIGGPGMISNNVLRSTGEGLIKIQYLINEEGCYGEITQRIPSVRTPNVEFETDSLSICIGEENVIGIIPDTSQLTLLYGPGMLDGNQLTSTDTGVLMITGQMETDGCVGADTLIISSHPIPLPEMTLDNPIICNGTSIQLTAIPPGGTFTMLSGAGTISGNTLTAFDIGPIQFAYTADVHQCAGITFGEILVINPVAEINVAGDMLTSSSSVGVFQWLDCENNFEPLPGESNDTLMVTIPGTYALVNGAGDCIDTSACVLVALTGIAIGETDQAIRIFPNPVSSRLFISGIDGLPVSEINLRNATGEKVYTQRDVNSSASMDMTGYGPGIYFLEMRFEHGGNYVFRVVKI
jgi:hypothetical protein